MKEHISATLERSILKRARRHALEERRTLSQEVELALEAYLERQDEPLDIVTTPGLFQGVVSRADTYGNR